VIAIVVNGTEHTIDEGITLVQLIDQMGLAGKRVAVERNREIVPRAKHGAVAVAAGDRIELVTFVGGG
jgi:sulfur carrier protein